MAISAVLVLAGLAAALAVAPGVAYGHGCQAQGGCCTVSSSCVETSAISPIYMMFAAVGLVGAILFKFYGGLEQRKRVGAVFNIFG